MMDDVVPGVAHFFADGVYAKKLVLAAGCRVVSHKHNYDHLSILAKGSVTVVVNGKAEIYVSPDCITIHRNMTHEIIAGEEDATFFCVHHTFETDPEKVDEVLIKRD